MKERVPKSSSKLPISEKIAYGMGSANDAWGNWLLPGIVWPVFNVFLGLPAHLVSIALLVNRLFDAVSDPFFGWASDNARTRFGRRRPFILVGSLLSGLGMIAFFWLIQPGKEESYYFWYLLIGSGILITLVSCFNMPYQSMGAEMTPDYEERTSVFAFRGGFQKLAEIGNFGAAAFISIPFFNENTLFGAKIFSLIIGTLMIAIGFITFFGTKERYYEQAINQPNNKVGIMEIFTGAMMCKPFRTQLAMAVSYGTCTSMVGTLGLYTTVYHVCGGDWAKGGMWNLAMGVSMVLVGFAGIPFFSGVAHRYGKRHSMILVLILSILAFGGTWFLYNPNHPSLQLVASGFNAFTMAGFWMLYGAIGADVIDYDELQSGKRREGAFSACGSFFMKIGLAIGMGGSGFVLQLSGFDQKLDIQSVEALTHIRFYLAAIPIIGLIMALVFILRFDITKKRAEEIRNELEARRGAIKG